MDAFFLGTKMVSQNGLLCGSVPPRTRLRPFQPKHDTGFDGQFQVKITVSPIRMGAGLPKSAPHDASGDDAHPHGTAGAGDGGTDMAALIAAACEKRPAPEAILVVNDGRAVWPPKPVGPRVVACLTQAKTAPKWIDSVVLNPAD